MTESLPAPVPLRTFDFIRDQLARCPRPDAFAQKVGGVWQTYATAEIVARADRLAWALLQAGVGPGDRVANATEQNRVEWNLIDIAVASLGAVHVPIYANASADDCRWIFEHSGATVTFASSPRLATALASSAPAHPILGRVVAYEPTPGLLSLEDLERAGADADEPRAAAELARRRDAVPPEAMAALVYTSGTTGTPKGVMLSHRNLTSNALAAAECLGMGPAARALSFLPLCHSYERTVVNMYLRLGTAVYYAESLETVGRDLREVQPHLFSTVPRLLEKIYERILERGERLPGAQRRLFRWAVGVAAAHDPDHPLPPAAQLRLRLADRLVYRKWREALGGRVRAIISGSAALRPSLARVFWAAGMPVYEGYGPTEASPVISCNQRAMGAHRIGTVGPVFPGGEVRIAADGEILYRGPNVMLGYYRRPDLTAEVIDAEGWLHTGDVGGYDGVFLTITDRKKEIFKTSGGKYIAPQPTENALKESRLIAQAMVVGENRKYPAALIVPNFTALGEKLGLAVATQADRQRAVADERVRMAIATEVERVNASLGQYARLKKHALLVDEWTVATGELTPTLKLKRKLILERHVATLRSLYPDEEPLAAALEVNGDRARRPTAGRLGPRVAPSERRP